MTPEYDAVVVVARDEDSSGLRLVARGVSDGEVLLVAELRTMLVRRCNCRALLVEVFETDWLLTIYWRMFFPKSETTQRVDKELGTFVWS